MVPTSAGVVLRKSAGDGHNGVDEFFDEDGVRPRRAPPSGELIQRVYVLL